MPLPEQPMSDLKWWLQHIHRWYPQLHSKTYFLPPVHVTRVPVLQQEVAGQQVHVFQETDDGENNVDSSSQSLQSIPDSLRRSDTARYRVFLGLRELATRGEVMMVISQLWFGNFVSKPAYAAAASSFRRRLALANICCQGDFDVLIIHRKHGLIIGEIKSVGANFVELRTSPEEQDKTVARRVQKGVNQLNKSYEILHHMTNFLTRSNVNISKTLMLPNLTSSRLLHALRSSHLVEKALCDCLGAKTGEEAVKMCLCSDQLLPATMSCDDTSTEHIQLVVWWQHLLQVRRGSGVADEILYERLVAGFCGPATTIEIPSFPGSNLHLEVRTEGEGVAEVGNRMKKLCLYPKQVEILNEALPRVFLTGPPGTGKTVMLYLAGSAWLTAGHDVHVVNTDAVSRAASFRLHQQLCTSSAEKSRGKAFLHSYDIVANPEHVGSAVSGLEAATHNGSLHVLADEIGYGAGKRFVEFCTQLLAQVPEIHLWAASVYNNITPVSWTEKTVTNPVRSPPVIVREVQRSRSIGCNVYKYMQTQMPPLADGNEVIPLYHEEEPEHSFDTSTDCEQCGCEIANVLRYLQVGIEDQDDSTNGLQYRDVMVVCRGPTDNPHCCGLVRGLRRCHVPVHVVRSRPPTSDVRVMALELNNEVTVADLWAVHGMEKKVVVVTSDMSDHFDRLVSASRCTAQLIWIDRRSS